MKHHVLIVEDEPLIAKDLEFILGDMGISLIKLAHNYEEAMAQLQSLRFDFILLDINIGSEKDGVDLAHYINEHLHTPFIFITSYYNKPTVARAKLTQPLAYLLKPFNKYDIQINVEMALYKAEQTKENASIYLRAQSGTVHLELNEILFLEAQDNYTEITVLNQKLLISQTLKTILEKLPAEQFVRTHKSFAIRLDKISMIKGNYIFLEDYKVPIGRSYKENFSKHISLL